jgi:hypothetical protein
MFEMVRCIDNNFIKGYKLYYKETLLTTISSFEISCIKFKEYNIVDSILNRINFSINGNNNIMKDKQKFNNILFEDSNIIDVLEKCLLWS